MPQVHALLTEDYLVDRKLNEQGVLDAVVANYLQLDLDASTPDLDPVLSDVAYRTRLVKALFYKVLQGEPSPGHTMSLRPACYGSS